MPRITGSASRSQRSRSPGDSPNSIPKSRASSSFHAEPIPRYARPLEMWSSAVAILAVSAGLRNGLAPTISPTRTCVGRLRPRGEGHVALEERAVGGADDRVQVIPRPKAVEAQPIGTDPGVEQRLPIGVLRPAQGAEFGLQCSLPERSRKYERRLKPGGKETTRREEGPAGRRIAVNEGSSDGYWLLVVGYLPRSRGRGKCLGARDRACGGPERLRWRCISSASRSRVSYRSRARSSISMYIYRLLDSQICLSVAIS